MADINKTNCINFDYNGKHYCLEYNRESVKRMEAAGYKPGESGAAPLLELDMLWAGAFYKNHRNTSSKVIENLLEQMTHKVKLLETLRTMIAETYNSLIDEEAEGDEGNAPNWTATI
jgi:hypothetical protein